MYTTPNILFYIWVVDIGRTNLWRQYPFLSLLRRHFKVYYYRATCSWNALKKSVICLQGPLIDSRQSWRIAPRSLSRGHGSGIRQCYLRILRSVGNRKIYYAIRIIVHHRLPHPLGNSFNRSGLVVGKRMAATWVVGAEQGGCRRCKSPWISSTDQRGTESPNLQILFNSIRRRRFYDFPPLHIHLRMGTNVSFEEHPFILFSSPSLYAEEGFHRRAAPPPCSISLLKRICSLQIITGGCLPISLYPVKFRISDHEEYENNNVVVTSRHHRWRGISFTRCGWMAEMLKAVNRRFTFE